MDDYDLDDLELLGKLAGCHSSTRAMYLMFVARNPEALGPITKALARTALARADPELAEAILTLHPDAADPDTTVTASTGPMNLVHTPTGWLMLDPDDDADTYRPVVKSHAWQAEGAARHATVQRHLDTIARVVRGETVRFDDEEEEDEGDDGEDAWDEDEEDDEEEITPELAAAVEQVVLKHRAAILAEGAEVAAADHGCAAPAMFAALVARYGSPVTKAWSEDDDGSEAELPAELADALFALVEEHRDEILAEGYETVCKAFDESKHARDHGKFAHTAGASGPPSSAALETAKLGKTLHPNVQVKHLASGASWVVKGRHGKRAAVQNEAAVSAIAQSLGLNVPQVHHVKVHGQDAAALELVDGVPLSALTADERKAALAQVPRNDVEHHALFDYLIGAGDSNHGNFLISDENRLIAIDKEQSLRFGTVPIGDKAEFRVPFFLEDVPPPKRSAGEHVFHPQNVAHMAEQGARVAEHLKAIGRAKDAVGVERRTAVLAHLAAAGGPVSAADIDKAGRAYDKSNPPSRGLFRRFKKLFGG